MNMVADIGGTHARFALLNGERIATQIQILSTADFKNLSEAIEAYLLPMGGRISNAVISIAAPLAGDRVKMTNADWDFSIQQTLSNLGRQIGLQSLRVMNDFEALALAVPTLLPDELVAIGHDLPLDTTQLKAVLGPGTGLGMAGVMPMPLEPLMVAQSAAPKWHAIPCEGGHASFAPNNSREAAILKAAWTIEPRHICWEDFLSGTGLPLLHLAVCSVDGFKGALRKPTEITQAAFTDNDAACLATLHIFCELLGSVAGDLALMVGARGGVYIKGGVLDRVLEIEPDFLQRSRFRERFEAKGAYSAYLQTIPTWFITAQQLALRGCATLL
jgi:glucokinase